MAEFPVLSQICANLNAMQKVSEKEAKGKDNVCQVIIEAKKIFLVVFHDVKGGTKKFKTKIHLENKMQSFPLACRDLVNISKPGKCTRICHAIQLIGCYHQT